MKIFKICSFIIFALITLSTVFGAFFNASFLWYNFHAVNITIPIFSVAVAIIGLVAVMICASLTKGRDR
jgi:hypothetical protein